MDTNDNVYVKTVRNPYKKYKGNTKGKLVGKMTHSGTSITKIFFLKITKGIIPILENEKLWDKVI